MDQVIGTLPAPIVIAPEEDEPILIPQPTSSAIQSFYQLPNSNAAKISDTSTYLHQREFLSRSPHNIHIHPPTWKPYEDQPRNKHVSHSPHYMPHSTTYTSQQNNFAIMDSRDRSYSKIMRDQASYRISPYNRQEYPNSSQNHMAANRHSTYSDYLRSFQSKYSPTSNVVNGSTHNQCYSYPHVDAQKRYSSETRDHPFRVPNQNIPQTVNPLPILNQITGIQPHQSNTMPHQPHLANNAVNRIAPLKHATATSTTEIYPQQQHHEFMLQRPVIRWTEIDGTKIPYLTRNNVAFISVRIVEVKFLSQFPDSYPQEIREQPPLKSTPVTNNECTLLEAMNKECHYEYGSESFQKDLIVELEEFKRFYALVKNCFAKYRAMKEKSNGKLNVSSSNNNAVSFQLDKNPENGNSNSLQVVGGWMQINNTVIPYILRGQERYIPICVIKYAAGLTLDEKTLSVLPTVRECKYLNETCNSAGLNFVFDGQSSIGALSRVVRASNKALAIKDLPSTDPFAHASYDPVFESEEYVNNGDSGLVSESVSHQSQVTKQNMINSTTSKCSSQQNVDIQGLKNQLYEMNMDVNHAKSHQTSTNIPCGQFSTKLPSFPFDTDAINCNPSLAKNSKSAGCMPSYTSHQNNLMKQIPDQKSPTNVLSHTGIPCTSNPYLVSRDIDRRELKDEKMKQVQTFKNVKNITVDKINKRKSRIPAKIQDAYGEQADVKTLCSQARDNCSMLIKLLNHEEMKKSNKHASSLPPNKDKQLVLQKPVCSSTLPKSTSIKAVGKITSVKIEKKTISVIRRKDGKNYALIEALSRVLFPELTLPEFVNAVEKVLHIDVVNCTGDEEKEFIKFYDLPTVSLKCNKMVQIDMFGEYLAPLSYMFRHNNLNNSKDIPDGQSSRVSKRTFESTEKYLEVGSKKMLKVSLVDIVKENICHDICQLYGVKFNG